ncbi:MAG: hypothetical protein LZF62_230042 [Nitrospira sp.]|nr:MAG: hypothetical protein LZF62_230042 [Nitrospira sp.]
MFWVHDREGIEGGATTRSACPRILTSCVGTRSISHLSLTVAFTEAGGLVCGSLQC